MRPAPPRGNDQVERDPQPHEFGGGMRLVDALNSVRDTGRGDGLAKHVNDDRV